MDSMMAGWQDEKERILASLTDDERADVVSLATPITFQASGVVNVYCASGRDYHINRNMKRFHTGRFIRIFERDLEQRSPDGAATALHHHEHPGQKIWRSVATPRSRTYQEHGEEGTRLEPWRRDILESATWAETAEGFGLDVEENHRWLVEHSEGKDVDPRDGVFPEVDPGDRANVLPSRWAHDPQLPRVGYLVAQHIVRDDGSIWFRMECPCKYRIRDIAETEISPIFDKLKAEQRELLSQRTALLTAGKDDEAEEREREAQGCDSISVQGLLKRLARK